MSAWHDTYGERGLVVVGIHTPETNFEHMDDPLERALERHWPALYLVDRRGNVAFSHFGEGDTESVEAAIRRLLAEPD